MCGIAGEVAATARPGARAHVEGMVASMKHRGPDGEGYLTDGGATLGMCRLAIIDVAGGEQPIGDGRRSIVYNGESYRTGPVRDALIARGRVFKTKTDTEVVLHAIAEHGLAGLRDLDGMFGFAIWDARDRELLLVRDRLGIKPLYYWVDGDRVVFASTMSAIAARPDFRGTIDREAVDLYLAHKFVSAPRTMYREIRKLPPGHAARWRDGRLTLEAWWDVPLVQRARSLDDAAEEVEALLRDSARSQLVSERPVGLCLSGGIDSGLLAHALRDDRTETFSLGFADARYDETPAAAQVAKAFGLPHHVLHAELDAARDLDAILAHYDEPVGDPSGVALFELSRLVAQHVTVVLSGTGGDELFGGYRRVLAGLLARGTRHLGAMRALPRLLGRDESKLGWRGQLARLSAQFGAPPLEAYRGLIAPASPDVLARIRRAPPSIDPASVFAEHFDRAEGSLLTRLLYTDLKTVLPDDYLVKEDRMTMAHSIEGRVPFLDHRLVELAFSLPDAHKVRGLTGKRLLRRLAREHLPAEIARAPKQGFEVPIAAWLRGALAPRVRALADDARLLEYVDPRSVIEEHLSGRADHGRLLWTLLTLSAWLGRANASFELRAPRIKVMVVSSSLGEGGAQRVASTLLDHLDRTRFAPTLCLFKPEIHFSIPDDVPVHVLGSARDEPLAELARTRPWLVGELLASLRKRIEEERPDVILSMMDQVSSVTATAVVGLRPRPRLVARVASHPERQGALTSAWVSWALGRADQVVVSSEALGEAVARRHPRAGGRLRCLPNLTDFDRLDALAAEPPARTRDAQPPLIVSVGRLTRFKRPDWMIDAFAALRRTHDARLWICGDADLEQDVRERIAARGLEGSVALLGFCVNPYALLRQADLFLLTSEVEGLPNALIEAQGLGVAAVSTDCDFGPREVIVPDETGLLVPPGDPDALAAAMRALLDDPARRAAMGAAARVRTRARFGVPALIEAWQRVLLGAG